MFISSQESRKSNVSISDTIDVSEGDQFPPHSTRIGLDDVDLSVGLDLNEVPEIDDTRKFPDRSKWSHEEEKILALSYITIGTDVVIGYYNNLYNNRTSGWSDKYVLEKSHEQWRHVNQRKNNKVFKYKHVWKIMNDSEMFIPLKPDYHASKKTRNSDLGEFTSFANMDTSIDLDDYALRPRTMAQKVAKRKGKSKADDTINSDSTDGTQWNQMLELQSQKVKQKEIELRQKDYEILYKDTSGMSNSQLAMHQKICDQITSDRGLM
ncbi:hypothetical protein L6452_22556 [Arctium lappa]|uniref:Uncharacterized protein n=1 Tax=Arctium lappa TaxID=4217 RepID=A0ACB9B4H1_ARCLA|nr:hypothetical protein L6452_22556 [Arctium lappa]